MLMGGWKKQERRNRGSACPQFRGWGWGSQGRVVWWETTSFSLVSKGGKWNEWRAGRWAGHGRGPPGVKVEMEGRQAGGQGTGILDLMEAALEKLPGSWRLFPLGRDLASGAPKTGKENGKDQAASPPQEGTQGARELSGVRNE